MARRGPEPADTRQSDCSARAVSSARREGASSFLQTGICSCHVTNAHDPGRVDQASRGRFELVDGSHLGKLGGLPQRIDGKDLVCIVVAVAVLMAAVELGVTEPVLLEGRIARVSCLCWEKLARVGDS